MTDVESSSSTVWSVAGKDDLAACSEPGVRRFGTLEADVGVVDTLRLPIEAKFWSGILDSSNRGLAKGVKY